MNPVQFSRTLVACCLGLACVSGPPPASAPLPTDPTAPTPPAPAAVEDVIGIRALRQPPPLELILQPVADKPIVSFRLVFRAGSVDDPPGKEGLTALTSALMSEGGTRELTSSQLLEALFPIAGELSSRADKEMTTFSGRIHRDNLERFYKIFTDILLEPRFDAHELERLRSDAINLIRNELRGEDDETLGKVALDALLYPRRHPYHHFVGGTVQGL